MPKHARTLSRKYTATPSPLNQVLLKVMYFFVTMFVALAVVAYLAGWRLYTDDHNQLVYEKEVAITGTVHFTALKPAPTDQGTIRLFVRQHGDEMWRQIPSNLTLQQDATWQWNNARPGITYDLRAELIIEGKVRKSSRMMTTTAPSHEVVLPLEVNWTDLPEDAITTRTTKLGGTVTVNGHIPDGSVLELYVLKPPYQENEIAQLTPQILSTAVNVATLPSVTAKNDWQWNEATPRQKYHVVAVLRSNGKVFFSSSLVAADAGEESLQHIINSPAQPTVRGVTTDSAVASPNTISGVVTLQGPKDRNTSLLMLWRKPGDANYNVIQRYPDPAHDGTNWIWPKAEVGQTYEITAALQVNEKNTSTAPNPARVTAPARNVNFNLNTYFVLPATTGQPVMETCLNRNSVNDWTAQIRIPTMANAGNYWVEVGDASDRMGNIYNQKFSAGENNQDFHVKVNNINNGKQYYVRYSYSTCEHCQNDNDFAPFSNTIGFTCE